MLQKILKVLCLILLLFLVASCAKVTIHDQEWCLDLGFDGAKCANTLTDKKRNIEKIQWDEIRYGMLCTTTDNFAEVKATIEKLCYKTKDCVYSDIEKLFKKVENLQ